MKYIDSNDNNNCRVENFNHSIIIDCCKTIKLKVHCSSDILVYNNRI